MKRVLMVLLVLTLLFSLMACSGQEAGSASTSVESAASDTAVVSESSSSETSEDTYDYVIGYALNDLDEAQNTLYNYLVTEFESRNCNFILANAANNIDQQITDIENFVTMGVDMIVVSALDSEAVVDACNAAMEAGIYVVDSIMGINTDCTMHIGYDFYSMAAFQAQYIIDYLKANPDKHLYIGYMWGNQSMELCQKLYNGFMDTMNESDVIDQFEITVEAVGEWTSDKSITIAEDWMQAYPQINCYVTQNDGMTCGCVEALKANGLNTADYITMGKDGSTQSLEYINSGDMTASIYSPFDVYASELATECYKILTGENTDIPGYEYGSSQFIAIDASNISEYYSG